MGCANRGRTDEVSARGRSHSRNVHPRNRDLRGTVSPTQCRRTGLSRGPHLWPGVPQTCTGLYAQVDPTPEGGERSSDTGSNRTWVLRVVRVGCRE